MRDNKAWGIQLRKWRQGVARSQHAFVDFLSQTNRDLSATEDRALKTIGLRERDGLTPNMLSKYELGERVPESRDRHLLLL